MPSARPVRPARRRLAAALAATLLAFAGPALLPAAAAGPGPADRAGPGYWVAGTDGGVFAFGGAAFLGSAGDLRLNHPIAGLAATPGGGGYWLVASDGGIFSFGDATFHGSTGAIRLNQPIITMAPTPTGAGYWMSAADGGVFSFGDARFHGAAAGRAGPGTGRVVGMVPTTSGGGYWQVTASGDVLAFGDAPPLGGPSRVGAPLVGMASTAAAGGPAGPPAPMAATPANDPDDPAPPAPPAQPDPPPTTTTTMPPEPWSPPQQFASVANRTWQVSPEEGEEGKKAGRILALAEAGGKVFIGGEHTGMVPPGTKVGQGPVTPRRYLSAVEVATGELSAWDAQPDDAVLALAVSPDGKRLFYVGGRFRTIGGGVSPRLAALDVETGRLVPGFNPPAPNSSVRAMALHDGKLFIGGNFESVGEVRRPAAALDAETGSLIEEWSPPRNSGGRYKGQTGTPTEDGNPGLIFDMTVTNDGKHLVIAGDFLHFGGEGGVLVLDTATGSKTSWQAEISRPAHGLAAAPSDPSVFYVATGGTGGQVQAFKAGGKSEKPLWIHKTDGDAMDVAATDERVYLVGHYDYVLGGKTICGRPPCEGNEKDGDTPNRHLSAFDARTGRHDLSFTAQANTPQGPYVAYTGRDHLYVGGDFTRINDLPQGGFVQFSAYR